jgi:hypothetical protein
MEGSGGMSDDRAHHALIRSYETQRGQELRAAGWAMLCALIMAFVTWCCHRAAWEDEFFLFGMALAAGLGLLCLFGALDCLRVAWEAHRAIKRAREEVER